MSKRRPGTPRHRPLRTWRVSFVCQIEPTEEAEGIQKYSDRASVDQSITIEVNAYTLNAARERVERALEGLVAKEK